jgi:hypothetical protein
MKTAIVWFSYPPDYAKLALSVARCRQLDPLARLFAVIESEHKAPKIEGVEVMIRDFSRGTHLDGREAVHGVAKTLAGIDAELIVKIDSDMVPSRAFWKDGPAVFQRANNFHVGLYALPSSVLKIVLRCLRDQPNPGPHEAIAICNRAVVAMHALGIPFGHHRLPAGEFFPEVLNRDE